MSVRDSHDIATDVKLRICAELDWVADVLVHVEPAPHVPDCPAGRTATR